MKKYEFASLDFLAEEVVSKEIEAARRCEHFDEYVAEAGWQDWMEDFVVEEDWITESEQSVIEDVQHLIWNER